MAEPLLSVVVPMYNESAVIDAFFEAVIPVLKSVTEDWEIVAVDDGSKDDTFAKLLSYHRNNSRIKIVRFSRNFGKEQAMTAGLDHVSGKATILLDADLQDPPSLIPEMVAKWKEGYEVVLGQRRKRNEPWVKTAPAHLFYWLINHLSSAPVPANTGDFRLMDRKVVQTVRRLKERTRFMRGVLGWGGFSTYLVPFDRPPRKAGVPPQTFRKLVMVAIDGIISVSNAPLRLATFMGVAICPIAFISLVSGASFWVALLFLLMGLQFLCIGILGEYVARIYLETRQQPIYSVAETLGIQSTVPGA